MSSVGSGRAVAWAATRAQWVALRQFLVWFGRAVVSALAASAACWGLPYIAAEASAKAGPPAGRAARDTATVDATVAWEAPRGIREIERYLGSARAGRAPSPRTDGDDGEPGAGTTSA